MKICFMTRLVHQTGGGSTKLFYEIIKEMANEGNQVTVISNNRVNGLDIDNQIIIKMIPIPILGNIIFTFFFGLVAFLKTRQESVDIYCFESGYLGIWTFLFKIFDKKPLISFSLRYGWNLLKLNLKSGKVSFSIKNIFYYAWEILFFVNEILDVYLSNKIIVLGEEAKNVWINNRIFKINKQKIKIIPFGVDLEVFRPVAKDLQLMKKLKINENEKVILYVGHLEFSRNIDKLLLGFELLLKKSLDVPKVKLIIVGSGPLENYLKNLTKNPSLEKKVIFIPHVHNENELNKIYNISDYLVLPQVPGTASIQATASGLPVVTIKNNKGLLGAIDKPILENFIFMSSDDPKTICDCLNNLFNNPKIGNKASHNGISLIDNYSWHNIHNKFNKFLKSLIK